MATTTRRRADPRSRRSPSISALGAAYRASGRDRPIFDTIGHNPYPNTSAEPPWARHEGGTIGEGDYGKLVTVLRTGFGGTGQPVPGQRADHLVHGGRLPDAGRTRPQPRLRRPGERPVGARPGHARGTVRRPPAAGPTTRRPSSPTPSGSPIASRTSARSSTSCSRTSTASAGGSRACCGRTGSRSRRTVPSPTQSQTSTEAGSTAPPSAGWADPASPAPGLRSAPESHPLPPADRSQVSTCPRRTREGRIRTEEHGNCDAASI